MKLQKAIEYHTISLANRKGELGYEGVVALQLLIEAGKRLSKCRDEPCWIAERLLPGETKD